MTAGGNLRTRIQAELDENGVTLGAVESELFERACKTADRVEQLEAVIDHEGVTTKGVRGTITHPALTEVRHLQALVKSLLLAIDTKLTPADAKTKAGRAAAAARWKLTPRDRVTVLPGGREAPRTERIIPEAI